MAANIPQYLISAQFAQLQYAEREATEAVFKGGFTTPRYSLILSVTRQAIQARYNKLPNDPTLQATGEFMYALSGGVNTTPNVVSTIFIIVIQPQSQTITSGSNVTFSVVVAGGVSPYTYQWSFAGTPIGGATSSMYSITGATTGNAGNYTVQIKDSAGNILNSNIAVLTVNAVALTGSYYYGGTDYFSALSGGTDAISYQGTFPITHNQPLNVTYPIAADNNMFLVIRVPIGESIKATWFNTVLNSGTIPDSVFRAVLQPIGLPLYSYYLTRIQVSNDFTSPLILT